MDITLVEQIVEYIRKLAEPIVTAGYELVLKQVQFIMVRDIIFTILMLIVIILFLVGCKKVSKWCEENESTDDGGAAVAYYILGGFASLGCLAGSLVNISSILNTIINPDWVAIKMIVSAVSGGG